MNSITVTTPSGPVQYLRSTPLVSIAQQAIALGFRLVRDHATGRIVMVPRS